jgi:hypothetical protein
LAVWPEADRTVCASGSTSKKYLKDRLRGREKGIANLQYELPYPYGVIAQPGSVPGSRWFAKVFQAPKVWDTISQGSQIHEIPEDSSSNLDSPIMSENEIPTTCCYKASEGRKKCNLCDTGILHRHAVIIDKGYVNYLLSLGD